MVMKKNVSCLFAQHVDGRIGLVPYNYIQKRSEVKLNAMVWFHGKISRDDAETLLTPREVSVHFVPVVTLINRYFCHRMACFLSENRQTFPGTTHCASVSTVKWNTTVSFTRTTN